MNGLLLINLGTPDHCDALAVKRYLREFLIDRRVIALPFLIRYLILYLSILPFRSRRTARAYQAIWTKEGSPLLLHSRGLQVGLQRILGENWKVALGMRYGNPSLASALEELKLCKQITILPLYPQYSSAATGSSIEQVLRLLAPKTNFPSLNLIRDFYWHPAFLNAQADLIKPYLANHDYLLFSYHGIPEKHLVQMGCKSICSSHCTESKNISRDTFSCYKAQCYATSQSLVKLLNLSEAKWGIAFQSRLGKTPWIKPYTDAVLIELANKGIKRLAIVCPSFVTDCLETLEEIGIRGKKQWQKLGGTHLSLIPCMNDNPLWISGLVELVQNP